MKKTIFFIVLSIVACYGSYAQSQQYVLAYYSNELSCVCATVLILNSDSTSEYIFLHINENVEVISRCKGYWSKHHNRIDMMREDYYNADYETKKLLRALVQTRRDECPMYKFFYYRGKNTLSSPLYDGNFHTINLLRLKFKDKCMLRDFLKKQNP